MSRGSEDSPALFSGPGGFASHFAVEALALATGPHRGDLGCEAQHAAQLRVQQHQLEPYSGAVSGPQVFGAGRLDLNFLVIRDGKPPSGQGSLDFPFTSCEFTGVHDNCHSWRFQKGKWLRNGS